jgi:hypothetical protein
VKASRAGNEPYTLILKFVIDLRTNVSKTRSRGNDFFIAELIYRIARPLGKRFPWRFVARKPRYPGFFRSSGAAKRVKFCGV